MNLIQKVSKDKPGPSTDTNNFYDQGASRLMNLSLSRPPKPPAAPPLYPRGLSTAESPSAAARYMEGAAQHKRILEPPTTAHVAAHLANGGVRPLAPHALVHGAFPPSRSRGIKAKLTKPAKREPARCVPRHWTLHWIVNQPGMSRPACDIL